MSLKKKLAERSAKKERSGYETQTIKETLDMSQQQPATPPPSEISTVSRDPIMITINTHRHIFNAFIQISVSRSGPEASRCRGFIVPDEYGQHLASLNAKLKLMADTDPENFAAFCSVNSGPAVINGLLEKYNNAGVDMTDVSIFLDAFDNESWQTIQ